MKPELQAALKILLANTHILQYQAHVFHWNCKGPRFSMCHKQFQKIYEALFEYLDTIAESLRMYDTYPPISLNDLIELSTVKESTDIQQDINTILTTFIDNIVIVIENIDKIIELSTNNQVILDLAIEQLKYYKKLSWILRSHLPELSHD